MTMLPIEAIHASEHNARHIASDTASDLELQTSMATLGLLQPIVVMRNGNGYTLIAGARRLAAAQALGWTDIETREVAPSDVMSDQGITAISAAENMVRAGMHPVDQWRAMIALTDHGYTLDGAAAALGLAPALARRLDHLGRMAPELIEALAWERELPATGALRVIALAPHDVQVKALAAAGKRRGIDWHTVAMRCERRRIPRALAIFDTEANGIVWDEDLFAEPGSDEQFTTTELAKFIAAQVRALEERAAASKGRIVAMGWLRDRPLRSRLPSGWRGTWEPMPKRWNKTDARRAFCCVSEEGWEFGKVETVVAVPADPIVSVASDDPSDTMPREPRPPISKATFNRLAALKTEAVRERLPLIAANKNPADMLRALLLVLSFENVALYDANNQYGSGPYRDLAHNLVDTDGHPRDVTEGDLCTIAADVIVRVVQFSGPDIPRSSGQAAEWLAQMVGATMPRCDTAEILKGVSGDMLMKLAREHGFDEKGKVSDLRARLVGHLPDWRPVDFDAPGPIAAFTDDQMSDEISDNDAAQLDPGIDRGLPTFEDEAA